MSILPEFIISSKSIVDLGCSNICFAESGLMNALLDTGRRIVQPKDYPCALCMVTYGPFGMKQDWKRFVNSLPYRVTFLHKDEADTILVGTAFNAPALILFEGNRSHVLLQATDFEEIGTLEALKYRVNASLPKKGE